MFVKSKFNSIEPIISQALIDIEISHKEFITIVREKDKYEKSERKFEKHKWEIKRKNWKHEIK